MSVFHCLAGKHAVLPGNTRNQGLHFSSCGRCGRGMVSSGGAWKIVPRGFRIVWKRVARPGAGSDRGLPSVIAIGPDRSAAAAAPRPAEADRGGSGFRFGELVSMGVRLLAWYGADGLRKWNMHRAARRMERQAVVLLLAG